MHNCFDDGRDNYIEIMTMDQIKQAWMQSSMIRDEQALEKSKHIIISKKKWPKDSY